MRKFGSENLVPHNLELERTIRKIQKDKREATNLLQAPMENLEGLRDEEDVTQNIPPLQIHQWP